MRTAVHFLFLLTICVEVRAQSTANIVGTIRDSSGAAVPAAKVTMINVQTGLRQTREAGGDGAYSIPLLPVGQYRLEVERPGFQRHVQSGITLAVSDNATLDVTLTVGSLSESVTVTAAAPLLETQTGTIRGVVDQQRIVDLPLNGRQITQLMAIQAGVIQRSSGTSEGDAFVVNGSRQSGVYFLLDGGMNTDSYRNYSGVFPNPDAVQEFSVQKSNFSAEYANATGAVMSVATKSGTNQLHGSAFEFLRNGAFNARNFFAARRDSLKRSQYGGTLEVSTIFATLSALSWDHKDWPWKINHDAGGIYEQLLTADLSKGTRNGGKHAFHADAWIPSDAIKGELAESWEVQKDPLAVVFKLKKGIMFSAKPGVMEARELTAEDVAFSHNYRQNSPKRPPGFTDEFTKAEARDRYGAAWRVHEGG